MLCPVQRGKGLDPFEIPTNQFGIDVFASEENAQDSFVIDSGSSCPPGRAHGTGIARWASFAPDGHLGQSGKSVHLLFAVGATRATTPLAAVDGHH